MIDPIGTIERGDVVKINNTLLVVNYIAKIDVYVAQFSVSGYLPQDETRIITVERVNARTFTTLDQAKAAVNVIYRSLDGWMFEQVVVGELV